MDIEPELGVMRRYSAPCPICKKHINQGEMDCFHCGYELSIYDIRLLKRYIWRQKRFGLFLGVVATPVILMILTLFFAIFY